MSKLLLTAITVCGVTAAAPALAQGYPGSLPYTNATNPAAYEEARGGLLGAVVGREAESDPKPQSDPM